MTGPERTLGSPSMAVTIEALAWRRARDTEADVVVPVRCIVPVAVGRPDFPWIVLPAAAAVKAHKALGPGLLETVYEHCLVHELQKRNVKPMRQVKLPITYDGTTLDAELRIDLLVNGLIIVEVKAVETLLPILQSQLLTYLKLSGCRLGLLINFNVPLLKDGI